MPSVLLISALVVSTCGLIYELLAGTVASYLLGDSVLQFSTVIGSYLFAMGVGSWFTRYINRNLLATFIRIELLVGLLGGSSAAILFWFFPHVSSFRFLLYALVGATGILVGVEIPLLVRLLKDQFELRELIARVFTFDYVGSLVACLLFPLVLVPMLGVVRTGFLFGLLNILVALWVLLALGNKQTWSRILLFQSLAALLFMIICFINAEAIQSSADAAEYPDTVVYSKTTPYQRLVITRRNDDLRLFLNGNLQFSSRDEYRYHEALVHVGMASLHEPKHILILGGGDGLALREILKYPSVTDVTLVDLDPAMTHLFSTQEILTSLNHRALLDGRLTVINQDAFVWLRAQQKQFDFIVIDFPDPGNFSVGKLYTTAFYHEVSRVLADQGAAVIQSTSPYFAPKSFWCVVNTLQAAGFNTAPYHVYVPSFGEWGYVLASHTRYQVPQHFPDGLRFINSKTVASMFEFPTDMIAQVDKINRLDNQALVHYFDEEWAPYVH